MEIENGSINLNEKEQGLVDLSGQVHQLPCSVKYDGPCSVSHYFKPKSTGIEVDGMNVEEAYFRGRKLQGTTLQIPHPYSGTFLFFFFLDFVFACLIWLISFSLFVGFVIGKKNFVKRKASDMSEEKTSNCWEVNAKFQNLTYWNHDTIPSHDDAFFRSFHWLAVAEAVSFRFISIVFEWTQGVWWNAKAKNITERTAKNKC